MLAERCCELFRKIRRLVKVVSRGGNTYWEAAGVFEVLWECENRLSDGSCEIYENVIDVMVGEGGNLEWYPPCTILLTPS